MQREAADHRLTLEARRRLAHYDGNTSEVLQIVEKLLEQFPDEQLFELERLTISRHYVSREERLATYERMCRRPESHPIFWQQYAQELRVDARRHDDAIWLLQRAIRRWPSHASNYFILANILWDRRQFDEALELYRLSVCLNDKDEQLAACYFSAASVRKRTDEALALLRAQVRPLWAKVELSGAHACLGLHAAPAQSRGAGSNGRGARLAPRRRRLVLLFAAQTYHDSSLENIGRASALLEQAKGHISSADYTRAAARIAMYDGRLTDALGLWQQALSLQPMLMEAHVHIAQLLAETQSRSAALEHLRQAARAVSALLSAARIAAGMAARRSVRRSRGRDSQAARR